MTMCPVYLGGSRDPYLFSRFDLVTYWRILSCAGLSWESQDILETYVGDLNIQKNPSPSSAFYRVSLIVRIWRKETWIKVNSPPTSVKVIPHFVECALNFTLWCLAGVPWLIQQALYKDRQCRAKQLGYFPHSWVYEASVQYHQVTSRSRRIRSKRIDGARK